MQGRSPGFILRLPFVGGIEPDGAKVILACVCEVEMDAADAVGAEHARGFEGTNKDGSGLRRTRAR